jgi:hypothetical protein
MFMYVVVKTALFIINLLKFALGSKTKTLYLILLLLIFIVVILINLLNC